MANSLRRSWDGDGAARIERDAEATLPAIPNRAPAIRPGLPRLSFSCPACQQVGSLDLRTLDRHPGASISSLIPFVSCRRCSPNAPFARLESLTSERP
jgi:hypothetical protein